MDEGEDLSLHVVDPALELAQTARVQAYRAQRDAEACESALAALGAQASADVNLMPAILDAARAGATVGEMCDAFRDRLGHLARNARVLARGG